LHHRRSLKSQSRKRPSRMKRAMAPSNREYRLFVETEVLPEV
jgi:hypothetical protein